MDTLTSRDGTTIAYDWQGHGPALILVDGALTVHSSGSGELARLLAPHFTVYGFDRRGRGRSGDTPPYAVDREIDDIEALADRAGGPAFLYGHSSGGPLAMRAAIRLGRKVAKLAMYEPPYNNDPDAQESWNRYLGQLSQALAGGRHGDAVALFMGLVGLPAEQIAGLRRAPSWPGMEAVAPTLAYDHAAIMGGSWSVPTGLAARVPVPALVMAGDAGLPFMASTARALSQAMPQGRLRILGGQAHAVDPAVLAPVLAEFLLSSLALLTAAGLSSPYLPLLTLPALLAAAGRKAGCGHARGRGTLPGWICMPASWPSRPAPSASWSVRSSPRGGA